MPTSLRYLDSELWVVDHDFSLMGLKIGTRTTVVRSSEELLLISPGPISEAQALQLATLGRVSALLAPNKMHHLYLAEAQARFPAAKTYIAPGLSKKRPDLTFEAELPANLTFWGLEQVLVEGMPDLNETALWHSRSATLILTDLAFNFVRHEHLPTRLFLRINGALGKLGPTRLLKHHYLKDRVLFRKSLDQILQWPIENVVVAHGEILVGHGQSLLGSAFREV